MKNFSHPASPRGSALVAVLLLVFVLLTITASVIHWGLFERRLSNRSAYFLEARNAAEAAAEYGCYQVAGAFSTKMNPTFGAGGVAIGVPSDVVSSFFRSSRVVTGSVEVRAGTVTRVPATALHFIDPTDPNNRFDPLIGRWVNRRDVTVLSKATIAPPAGQGGSITSYITEKVSIRGAPLLAYAIFYSGNDLEFNPAPNMDIYGPVHVNGNMFVGPVSNGVSLNFHGPVTMSGNIFHAWRGTTSTAQEGGSTISSSSAVRFATDIRGVALFDMRTAGGIWNDSTMGNSGGTSGLVNLQAKVTAERTAAFAAYASQNWKGSLQTAAHGIQAYNPMGFSEIVAQSGGGNVLATDDTADEGSVVGTGSGYGHGYGPHSLIEAPLPAAPATDPYADAKAAIEEQKFSRKAGLYIQVQVDASSNLVGDIKFYGDPGSAADDTPAAKIGPNGGIMLGTAPSNVIQYIKYTTTAISSKVYVRSGLYDQHQDKGVNLVQIDMAELKTALLDMIRDTTHPDTTIYYEDNTTKWGMGDIFDAGNQGYDQYNLDSYGYNGGIFVDIINASTVNHTALLLANGAVANGDSLVPVVNNVGNSSSNAGGLTIATNSPVYILGHFNADGTLGSNGTANSAGYPDDSAGGTPLTRSNQSPVAIAADAVTILSPNYFGTSSSTDLAPLGTGTDYNGNNSSAYKSRVTKSPTASASTEIAAALISGSNTTSATSGGTQEYSGGVHNMPRFLEDWSGKTVAIRGSLVSMYNTRIATGLWGSDYYDPPNRQWGFDQLFANGTYPPMCPQVISYRRVDFTYINAADYANAMNRL